MTFAQSEHIEDSATKRGVEQQSNWAEDNSFESLLILAILYFSGIPSKFAKRAGSDSSSPGQKRISAKRSRAMCLLGVVVFDSFMRMFTMVRCYIPSCDSPAHVFLSGLVGRAQDWRADSREFESGSGKKKKKKSGAFSLFPLLLY